MSFVVRITDTALHDVERNADWWAEHNSVEQALVWFAAVQKQILSLDNMPERCPLAPENPRFPMELREKIVGVGPRPNYRAVFAIFGEEVRVYRVLSASQDELPADGLGSEHI